MGESPGARHIQAMVTTPRTAFHSIVVRADGESEAGSNTSVTPTVTGYHVRRVPDTVPNIRQGLWGDLPSGFVPKSIAATSATEAWVSGDGGIYHTTNSGTTWTSQYTSNSRDICVKDIGGGVKKGWAVTAGGKILRTTDGATWNELTSPTFSGAAHLAVYDDDHVGIAHGSSSFLLWDGMTSTWTTDTTDSSTTKYSVSWAGGTSVVAACYTPSVRSRQGTLWQSMTPISPANWKMRYLVCRLDGYSYPIDESTGIPSDIKNMIDRAVNADAIGVTGLIGTPNGEDDGRFIIDDAPATNVGRTHSPALETCLDNILGAGNVHREGSSDPDTNTYAYKLTNVMGYSSSGSYDPSAESVTTLWRPSNIWKDGAIGMFWNVSADCRTLRSPLFGYWLPDPANVHAGYLKVYLWGHSSDLYSAYQLKLQKCTIPGQPDPLTDVAIGTATYDTAAVPVTYRGQTSSSRVAEIDLSAVTGWPNDGQTYFAVHFPSGDLKQALVVDYPNSDIHNAITSGITYFANTAQCLSIDLIHEGCTATVGNVTEPGGGNTPNPEIILPQYAAGRTWAESAWMGIPSIPWMQVAIGDPLMAPYAGSLDIHRPTVSFNPPSPIADTSIAGNVTIYVSADPDPGTECIQRVQVWVSYGQSRAKIADLDKPPYVAKWDTLQMSDATRVYPDRNYTIEAVAYQSGGMSAAGTCSRAITLDNAGVPAITIANPDKDDEEVREDHPVTATVGTGNPSPAYVRYWLLDDGVPVDLNSDGLTNSGDWYAFGIPPTTTDAIYNLQAITYASDGSTPESYSYPRRIGLNNGLRIVAGAGGLFSRPDDSNVVLMKIPVVMGTSSGTGGMFYAEDANRASGIRVITNQPVEAGMLVNVQGVLHKSGDITERYIQATDDCGVWDINPCTPPAPLGMPGKLVGGNPPADNVGLTHAPTGLYNTGLLVRTWGRVTYVGSDFAYIDDGLGLVDGNDLPTLTVVPPYSGDTQTWSATGVRVYFGSLPKPGLGDYVAVTGVSSLETVGENRVRMIRVPDASCLTCNRGPYRDGHVFEDQFRFSYDGPRPWRRPGSSPCASGTNTSRAGICRSTAS